MDKTFAQMVDELVAQMDKWDYNTLMQYAKESRRADLAEYGLDELKAEHAAIMAKEYKL